MAALTEQEHLEVPSKRASGKVQEDPEDSEVKVGVTLQEGGQV